jgi:hypothetical protein
LKRSRHRRGREEEEGEKKKRDDKILFLNDSLV